MSEIIVPLLLSPTGELLSPTEISQSKIAYIDENNQSNLVSLKTAISLIKERIRRDDAQFHIQRCHHPLVYILCDENSVNYKSMQLSDQISKIPQFDLLPANREQAAWMRCLQFDWYIKGIRLAYLIFSHIPDPLASDSPFINGYSELAIKNLILNTNADFALYKLLKAGKSHILTWAEHKGIDYPFERNGDDVTDLFLHILKTRFKNSLEENFFNPSPINLSKKAERKQLAEANKFLSDVLDDSTVEKYEKALRKMGWRGYCLLALRLTKHDKLFEELWREFIYYNRQFNKFIDHNTVYWENQYPYHTTNSRTKYPIFYHLDEEGAYFYWSCSKPRFLN